MYDDAPGPPRKFGIVLVLLSVFQQMHLYMLISGLVRRRKFAQPVNVNCWYMQCRTDSNYLIATENIIVPCNTY
jgi:hypothetical protein